MSQMSRRLYFALGVIEVSMILNLRLSCIYTFTVIKLENLSVAPRAIVSKMTVSFL
jgi:hypothetical protein